MLKKMKNLLKNLNLTNLYLNNLLYNLKNIYKFLIKYNISKLFYKIILKNYPIIWRIIIKFPNTFQNFKKIIGVGYKNR